MSASRGLLNSSIVLLIPCAVLIASRPAMVSAQTPSSPKQGVTPWGLPKLMDDSKAIRPGFGQGGSWGGTQPSDSGAGSVFNLPGYGWGNPENSPRFNPDIPASHVGFYNGTDVALSFVVEIGGSRQTIKLNKNEIVTLGCGDCTSESSVRMSDGKGGEVKAALKRGSLFILRQARDQSWQIVMR